MNSELSMTDTLISTVAGGSPAVQALTLDYARLQIRSYGTVENPLLASFIDAAASYFAEQTGRPTLTETRLAGLPAFPYVGASGSAARIELPHPPLQRVRSVQYIDANGVLQSFVAAGSPATPLWRAVTYAGNYAPRGFVEPLAGYTWPTARDESDSVRITYDCGYGDTAASVPALVKAILGSLVGQFDTFRSATEEIRGQIDEVPYSVRMLLDGFKYSAFPTQVLRRYAYVSGQMWSTPCL